MKLEAARCNDFRSDCTLDGLSKVQKLQCYENLRILVTSQGQLIRSLKLDSKPNNGTGGKCLPVANYRVDAVLWATKLEIQKFELQNLSGPSD